MAHHTESRLYSPAWRDNHLVFRQSEEVHRLHALRIALIVTTREGLPHQAGASYPHDAFVELDTDQNIESYVAALTEAGHEVNVVLGNCQLPKCLTELQPDICFNLAEGFQGEDREAHVPAMLEMMGLRYTGPTPLGAAISLSKPVTKHILRSWGLPTPDFQVFRSCQEPISTGLEFPLFAKPAHEGGGMGIGNRSLCRDEQELRASLAFLIGTYREPVLVETYIEGREITCGVIGNGDDLHILPPNEIEFCAYPTDLLPVYGSLQKFDYSSYYRHTCPAPLSDELNREIRHLTEETFRATLCRDFARVDFRVDRRTERPTILEVNSLPGITSTSDLTLMAEADGWTHGDVVRGVLDAALRRYGMAIE